MTALAVSSYAGSAIADWTSNDALISKAANVFMSMRPLKGWFHDSDAPRPRSVAGGPEFCDGAFDFQQVAPRAAEIAIVCLAAAP
jgi:hypothetical protein